MISGIKYNFQFPVSTDTCVHQKRIIVVVVVVVAVVVVGMTDTCERTLALAMECARKLPLSMHSSGEKQILKHCKPKKQKKKNARSNLQVDPIRTTSLKTQMRAYLLHVP
jgi:hypothetical protein